METESHTHPSIEDCYICVEDATRWMRRFLYVPPAPVQDEFTNLPEMECGKCATMFEGDREGLNPCPVCEHENGDYR